MPGYIKKLLLKYKHRMPKRPQHCPYSPAPKQYGANAQAPLPVDISPKLSPEEIKEIQRVVGSILYYARAVDITVLMALSSIAIEQTKGTTSTMGKAKQLLDYLTTHPDATIRYRASDMVKMYTHTLRTYRNLTPKAALAAISSWDGPPKTEIPSASMVHFLHYVQSFASLSHLRWKPNWVPSS